MMNKLSQSPKMHCILMIAATVISCSSCAFVAQVPVSNSNRNVHRYDQFSSSRPSSNRRNGRFISSLHSSPPQVENNNTQTTDSEKTLYEILNSTPEATRSELKRNYISLVRKTHPDALISKGEDVNDGDGLEYQDIVQAWKTLSNPFDRKRYDRKLRAAAFTAQVENAVGAIGRSAGPQFLEAFENVALPFLRRTTATTVAGFSSIGEDIANYGSSNATEADETGLGGIIGKAVKSSQNANKAIDSLELAEKSRELKKRSTRNIKKAQGLRDDLNVTMSKRVKLSLHTPNVNLTSLEAKMILDGMNIVDELKMSDIVRLRHTVTYEIELLELIEDDEKIIREANQQLATELERNTLAVEESKDNVSAAIKAEERAWKALEDAQSLVASTKEDSKQTLKSLSSTTEKLTCNEVELEKIFVEMTKQQEKVRVVLRRKEEALQMETEDMVKGDFKDERIQAATQTIEELLKEENNLRAESKRLDSMAERLSSRADKLQTKANELEKVEDEAWNALQEGVNRAGAAAKSGYEKSQTL